MPDTCRVVVEERERPRRCPGNDCPVTSASIANKRDTVVDGNVETLKTESP